MIIQSHFDVALFAFLEALRSNNNRAWFQAHKQRYEREVRAPMLRFIGDVGPHLWQISPRFVADARPNGRSPFRVHRDVRFAHDKRPYKTNAGAHFRHEAGRDAHAPGFYLHLEPGRVFVASGVWHPDRHAPHEDSRRHRGASAALAARHLVQGLSAPLAPLVATRSSATRAGTTRSTRS